MFIESNKIILMSIAPRARYRNVFISAFQAVAVTWKRCALPMVSWLCKPRRCYINPFSPNYTTSWAEVSLRTTGISQDHSKISHRDQRPERDPRFSGFESYSKRSEPIGSHCPEHARSKCWTPTCTFYIILFFFLTFSAPSVCTRLILNTGLQEELTLA